MTTPEQASSEKHQPFPQWARLLISLCCCQLLLMLIPTANPLRGQGVPQNQPGVGQRAPDFELPLVGQKKFLSLRDEYRDGPVVVIVLRGYPGYQCPVCKSQFNAVVNRAKALSSESKCVVLVYPGKADQLEKNSKRFLGSRKLPHPIKVVRDDDMQMVKEWGIRWEARNQTAYPATFVVDQNGRIAWKKISSTSAGRSTVEEILRELRKL
ncbi:MAG: redoxin family protein [Rubripirellula sp.]